MYKNDTLRMKGRQGDVIILLPITKASTLAQSVEARNG